jgi:hypothetical protein
VRWPLELLGAYFCFSSGLAAGRASVLGSSFGGLNANEKNFLPSYSLIQAEILNSIPSIRALPRYYGWFEPSSRF